MFLYLSVELELKIISSTGCTIILSGDHEFPARAKCLQRKVSICLGFFKPVYWPFFTCTLIPLRFTHKQITERNRITKIIFKFRRKGLERPTLCNNFHENRLIYKKVIEKYTHDHIYETDKICCKMLILSNPFFLKLKILFIILFLELSSV